MTYFGITQCNSGWPLQKEPDPIKRMVPFSTNRQTNFQTLGESPSGLIRNQPEHKTPSLRLSNPRPSGLGCRCPKHPMGKPSSICFSSHRPAIVLGSSGDVSGHTKTATTHSHSAQTTTEQPIPCQPIFPQSPHVVSRSSTPRTQVHCRGGRKNCCSSKTSGIHL